MQEKLVKGKKVCYISRICRKPEKRENNRRKVLKKQKKIKKSEKKLRFHWKKSCLCIILLVLFTGICQNMSAEDGKKLALQESEIERLKAEQAKLQAENIQIRQQMEAAKAEIGRLKTENAQKKAEQKKLEQEISRLKFSLGSSMEARRTDVETLKSAQSAELKRTTSDYQREMLRLNAELKRTSEALEAERSKLKTGFDSDRKALADENALLRKELLETLNKYSALSAKWKRVELSAASVIETLSPVFLSERELELTETLADVLKAGAKLAAKSTNAAEIVNSLLAKIKIDDVEAAKVRVAMDELTVAAGKFAMLNMPPVSSEKFESCRILKIDDRLKVVILGAGYRNGVRVNMTLTAEGKDPATLKVIAVRQFVSAAVTENGDLSSLAPGVVVHAVNMAENKKQ